MAALEAKHSLLKREEAAAAAAAAQRMSLEMEMQRRRQQEAALAQRDLKAARQTQVRVAARLDSTFPCRVAVCGSNGFNN